MILSLKELLYSEVKKELQIPASIIYNSSIQYIMTLSDLSLQWPWPRITKALEAGFREGFLEGMTVSRKGRGWGGRGRALPGDSVAWSKAQKLQSTWYSSVEWLLNVLLHFPPFTQLYCYGFCHCISNALDTENYARQWLESSDVTLILVWRVLHNSSPGSHMHVNILAGFHKMIIKHICPCSLLSCPQNFCDFQDQSCSRPSSPSPNPNCRNNFHSRRSSRHSCSDPRSSPRSSSHITP